MPWLFENLKDKFISVETHIVKIGLSLDFITPSRTEADGMLLVHFFIFRFGFISVCHCNF